MVQLVSGKTIVCQGGITAFTCSANTNPAVHTYQLYVNGTMVNEVSSTGVWNRIMTTGGVFVYKCKVNNTIGTAISENVTITVKGNYIFFSTESRRCPGPSFSALKQPFECKRDKLQKNQIKHKQKLSVVCVGHNRLK